MKVRGAEKGSVGGGGGGRKQCKAVTHLEVLQFLSHIREVPYTQQSRRAPAEVTTQLVASEPVQEAQCTNRLQGLKHTYCTCGDGGQGRGNGSYVCYKQTALIGHFISTFYMPHNKGWLTPSHGTKWLQSGIMDNNMSYLYTVS